MKKQQNWWDKLGEPQYGDELVIRSSGNITNFDPYFVEGLTTIQSAWMERPIADDWMIDPKEWDPATDPDIDAKYDLGNPSGKKLDKAALAALEMSNLLKRLDT